jgi:hypothetical protein
MSRILIGSTLQQHDPQTAARLAVEMSGYHIHASLQTATGTTITVTTAYTYYIAAGWSHLSYDSGTDHADGNATTGKITIGAKGSGLYMVNFTGMYYPNKAANIFAYLYQNEGALGYTARGQTVAAAAYATIACSTLVSLVKDDYISVRFTSSVNTTLITLSYAELLLTWIAGE